MRTTATKRNHVVPAGSLSACHSPSRPVVPRSSAAPPRLRASSTPSTPPIAIDQLQTMMIALRMSESTELVRPAANDPTQIKQIWTSRGRGLSCRGETGSCRGRRRRGQVSARCAGAVRTRRATARRGRPDLLAATPPRRSRCSYDRGAPAVRRHRRHTQDSGIGRKSWSGPADGRVTMGHLQEHRHPEVRTRFGSRAEKDLRAAARPVRHFAATEQGGQTSGRAAGRGS